MRVAVTGASGFIGRYVLKELVARDYSVTAVTRASEPPLEIGMVDWHTGVDYRDPEGLIPEGTQALVHLAADMSAAAHGEMAGWFKLQSSYAAFLSLAEVRAGRLIFASSLMVYGHQSNLPVAETAPCMPDTNYGLSKLAVEALLFHMSQTDTPKVICLRIGEVYGLGQSHGFVRDKFLAAGLAGKDLKLYGNYRQIRDFIYVKDVARAIAQALESEEEGVFNIGGGVGRSLEEYARTCVEVLGRGAGRLEYVPEDPTAPRLQDFWMSIEKAREAFGYEPSFSLESAMGDIQSLADKRGHHG